MALEAKRKTTSHTYNIDVFTKKATFVENTLFFPGWTLYDNGIDITKDIEYQDPSHKGLITFRLEKGTHKVELVFKNTKVRQVAEMVSLIGIICLLLPLICKFRFREILSYLIRRK